MIILALVLLWTAACSAAPYDFSGEGAKAYVDTLCGEQFGGRKSGDPEAHRAELWAAAKFAEFGLSPGGADGYLQSFPILCNREERAELELINGYHGRKIYQNGEDFHLITNSGSGKIEAEVVFVGYGISESARGRDDFIGIDLRGKIALIYKAVPGSERLWEKQLSRDYKVKAAVEHGAIAVIFFHDEKAISGAAIHQEAFFPELPVIMVGQHVVVDFLRGTGRELGAVKKTLEKDPQSFNTGKILKINTRLNHNPQAQATNVIGILPGSDAALRHEWIVLGAHLDHNGGNAEGDVFYGADDNASGAAILLELARGFAALPERPQRSLLFVEFAAEEQGLLGSEYFVHNPPVPLDSIAAMFNFDCCGVGEGLAGMGGAEHFPEIWEEYKMGLDSTELANLTLSTIWRNGSDNHSFQQKGVPTFNYWSRGERSFYHLQEDLPQTVSARALGGVGRAAADFIAFLADWEKPLLKEHYRARTYLYSAYAIDLHPISLPAAEDSAALSEMLNARRCLGLKCATVAISSVTPYEDVDFWRNLCAEKGFKWSTNAEEIRAGIREQKLALLPVITDLAAFDSGGAALRNLQKLGAKTVLLRGEPADSASGSCLLRQCSDLGLLLLVPEASPWKSLLPPDSRKAIHTTNISEEMSLHAQEEAKKWRLVTAEPLQLEPDSAGTLEKTLYLSLKWGNQADREQSLLLIEELEKAGFTGQQIVYMLGENLLEILPE